MKGLQGDRGAKGVKGVQGPPVRKKNSLLLPVYVNKHAKFPQQGCFILQGAPGAHGHHSSTTQREESRPKPGPRSQLTHTNRPRIEGQDDVGESFFFFSVFSFLIIVHVCS